jgi:hypothetical protein
MRRHSQARGGGHRERGEPQPPLWTLLRSSPPWRPPGHAGHASPRVAAAARREGLQSRRLRLARDLSASVPPARRRRRGARGRSSTRGTGRGAGRRRARRPRFTHVPAPWRDRPLQPEHLRSSRPQRRSHRSATRCGCRSGSSRSRGARPPAPTHPRRRHRDSRSRASGRAASAPARRFVRARAFAANGDQHNRPEYERREPGVSYAKYRPQRRA